MIYKNFKFFLFLILSAGIITDGFAESKSAASKKSAVQNESERQQIIDFSLAGYGDRGKKSWDVAGESADLSTDVIKLNNITSNFYGENDTVKLTADTGDFNKTGGKLHVENNVVVTISSGGKLTTDSLDWDRNNQTVSTPDKVNVTKENIEAVGHGAVAETALNKMNFTKDVQVDIKPVEDAKKTQSSALDKVTITCDGPMEMDYQRKIATFNKDVKVDAKDAIIFSDLMEVYFLSADSKNKAKKMEAGSVFMGSQIERIRAWGNVRILRGENISYSDEAIYMAADNKIVLTGRPKLIISTAEDFKNNNTGSQQGKE